MEVLKLTRDPQVDAKALKQCIENDPSLTGKLLRVVNSSLFGLAREVTDLNQALALLGTKPLKLLVLSFSLPDGLFVGIAGETLQWYWRRTLTKAVAGRELSEVLWQEPGDDAFVAGLLQDLGVLLLIQELGEPYVAFLEKAWTQERDLAILEREAMGFDHTQLTARLLAQWELPERLIQAVSRQTDSDAGVPPLPSDDPLRQCVYLAELVARLLTDEHSTVLRELMGADWRERGFTESQLEELVDRLQEKVRQLAEVLSLQLPDGLDYRDVLAQAHGQISEIAVEAAGDLLQFQQQQADNEREEATLREVRVLSETLAQFSSTPAGVAPDEDQAAAAEAKPADTETTDTAPAGSGASPTPVRVLQQPQAAGEASGDILAHLTMAVATCRQSRWSLSLLLIGLDDRPQNPPPLGPGGSLVARRRLEQACLALEHSAMVCVPLAGASIGLVLPDCDRSQAVRLGNQMLESIRTGTGEYLAGTPFTVGIGAATVSLPPKNFSPESLLRGAERCLYGSHASGGNLVKSIEIY